MFSAELNTDRPISLSAAHGDEKLQQTDLGTRAGAPQRSRGVAVVFEHAPSSSLPASRGSSNFVTAIFRASRGLKIRAQSPAVPVLHKRDVCSKNVHSRRHEELVLSPIIRTSATTPQMFYHPLANFLTLREQSRWPCGTTPEGDRNRSILTSSSILHSWFLLLYFARFPLQTVSTGQRSIESIDIKRATNVVCLLWITSSALIFT